MAPAGNIWHLTGGGQEAPHRKSPIELGPTGRKARGRARKANERNCLFRQSIPLQKPAVPPLKGSSDRAGEGGRNGCLGNAFSCSRLPSFSFLGSLSSPLAATVTMLGQALFPK
ncbi:unnamed protein product [Bursaphelenchus xylophilus]|uniref:(pine wood nematode) hypothetical protein n=1 Tax=Bursaphelenchus xylophilus TaxID=6326 RepID=A0A1I7SQT8_BURXY|nr:unnamed protein product [Bursaphelenchus xylophilus]CAG9110372.1 unnamed protein product [Bursaphelenchus xylophilus]